MTETIISGLIAFIGTNIDDIFINMLFFSEADDKRETRNVVIGKYLGIGTLTLISLLGAFGFGFIPGQYSAFLGLIPIGLGGREIICHCRRRNASENNVTPPKTGSLLWSVMLVTTANGTDNIGVYLPLFAGYRIWQLGAVLCVFAVMIALWCFLSKKLSDLPFLQNLLRKYKHIIVPAVYIALGIYIILKNIG